MAMRKNIIVLFAVLALMVAFMMSCGDDQDALDEEPEETTVFVTPEPDNAESDYVSDEVLIQFKPGTSGKMVTSVNAQNGTSVKREIGKIRVKVLKAPAGQVQGKIRALRQHPSVMFAEPNYKSRVMFTDPSPIDDPGFSSQWGMTQINAPEAWNITKGDASIKIAILDTGIDRDHVDLTGKIVAEKDFTGGGNPDDYYGHGTHVAGAAAAITNNGTGVVGVGYNCYLVNAKVLGDNGSGDHASIADGIAWAVDSGAKVINMSLGSYSSSETMKLAVAYAWDAGCIIVAAAGNEGIQLPSYPAYYEQCIAVAATNTRDIRAAFSNHGDWVDVGAPGVDIWSTLPDHAHFINSEYGAGLGYGYLSGTSMAAPHVAGLAGLVWATNPDASNTLVRSRIENTCVDMIGRATLYGRVDAYQAVQ